MKGWWESSINVWFPFMYSQKLNCYFQNKIIMFYLPVPTHIYLWEIYIFPGSVCLFCFMNMCGPILGIYWSLTDTVECGNWVWGHAISRKGIHKWDFCAVRMALYVKGTWPDSNQANMISFSMWRGDENRRITLQITTDVFFAKYHRLT